MSNIANNQPIPWQDNSYTRMRVKTKSGSVYTISKEIFDSEPKFYKEGASKSKILVGETKVNVGEKAVFTFVDKPNDGISKAKSIKTSTVEDISYEVGIRKDMIKTKNSLYTFTPNYDVNTNKDIIGYMHNIKFPTPDNTVPISSMSEISPDKPFVFKIHSSAPEELAGKTVKTGPVDEHRFRVDYAPYKDSMDRELPEYDASEDYHKYDHLFEM